MSKRKRDEEVDGYAPKDFRQQRRMVAAFEQSTKQLAKTFNLARGFERQKLGRRKKTAVKEKNENDEARIVAEITALKALDLTAAAQYYLSKSLLKIKSVQKHPDLPAELSKPTRFTNDPATVNVHSRLCKSNPVRNVFDQLLGDIKREFGVGEDVGGATAKKRRLRKQDFEPHSKDMSNKVSESSGVEENLESNVDSDDDLERLQDRLASSEDEDDVEISDIEDLERRLEEEGIVKKNSRSKSSGNYDLAADLSLSEASDEESEDAEPKKATTSIKSSFVPSLAMGGYISGSGSDLEDDIDIAPRKNRRGQRARQQIWEKKYGTSAKHLQNDKQERGAGWDPKRGAIGGVTRGKKKDVRSERNFGKGANSTNLGKDRRSLGYGRATTSHTKNVEQKNDSRPLHPSWEAAKQAKEKKSVPVVFQGKKISFD